MTICLASGQQKISKQEDLLLKEEFAPTGANPFL